MSGLFKAIGKLFGGDDKPPEVAVAPPVVEAPPVMPLPDDKAVEMAKRRSIAAQLQRRGRASTILTADGDLGSPPALSDKLGS